MRSARILQKIDRFLSFHRVKYWEIIADNLSKAGWSWAALHGPFQRANDLDCRRTSR
jgi:hypothetical protein